MTKSYTARTLAEIAVRVITDIPDGSYVNLGIGRPMAISNYLPPDKDIILQSENGILGMGPMAADGKADPDYTNAGKQPITLLPGAALFHHGDSFTMIRGGHLDVCVLGAFQVSERGDLANWQTLDKSAIPAVGGAMDLAFGAKAVFVIMDLLTPSGESKLVRECTYPLTGAKVVKRIYTELATLVVTGQGLSVIDRVDGLSHAELEKLSGLTLQDHSTS